LLISLKNINKISGSTNATLNLSTAGSSGAEIKRNLNGQVMLNLQQGYLYGFDVEYYLNQAQVLAKKLPKDTQLIDNKRTPFDQLTGIYFQK
jgi:uncharacterized protein involved in outer membrane biogenesis